MKWKTLLVIFKTVKWTHTNGKTYTDTMSADEIYRAQQGYNKLAGRIVQNTLDSPSSWVEFQTEMRLYGNAPIDELRVDKTSDQLNNYVYLDAYCFDKAMRKNEPTWNLKWQQYDSIFCVFPWNKAGLAKDFRLVGMGQYEPQMIQGTTYACFPGIYASSSEVLPNGSSVPWDLSDENAMLHEWLHGACRFFKQLGFPIPKGESHDDDYKYAPYLKNNSLYYKDLMRGELLSASGTMNGEGINKNLWVLASPTNALNLVGHGAVNPAAFKTAYQSGTNGVPFLFSQFQADYGLYNPWKGFSVGTPDRKVQRWGDGETQFFVTPVTVNPPLIGYATETFALMQGDGKSCFYVPPQYLNAYLKACKLASTGDTLPIWGYPINAAHGWGNGNIIDFEAKNGSHAGVMNKTGSSNYWVVKGSVWVAYVNTAGNGATSYLGYPIEQEQKWKDPTTQKEYYVQYFEGGFCWVLVSDVTKFGNNRNWNINNTDKFPPPLNPKLVAGMWMTNKGASTDQGIYFSPFSGSNTTSIKNISGLATTVAPTIALFMNQLYLAWRKSDQSINCSVYNGSSWGTAQKIGVSSTSDSPALGAYKDKLYLLWKGAADNNLYSCFFNGSVWSAQQKVSIFSTNAEPVLAVYNDKLYMAWKGTDQGIYVASFDGSNWSAQQKIPNSATSDGLALAAFNNKLYIAWKGMNTDTGIYFSSFDGGAWLGQTKIPIISTNSEPTMASFNGKLYLMWKGTDQSPYFSTLNGSTWNAQAKLPGASSHGFRLTAF